MNEPALTSKMFQAINDGDVDALTEILTEQGPQLNNIKTVSTSNLATFVVIRCEAHCAPQKTFTQFVSLLARCVT